MSPDDMRQTITALALLLMLVGFLMAALPVAECPSCVHCARQRAQAGVICPLHKIPRSTCDRYHKDEDGG